MAQALDEWLRNGDSVGLWESNKLTASDRRILITQWTGRADGKIDSVIKNRTRLFEKTGLATTTSSTLKVSRKARTRSWTRTLTPHLSRRRTCLDVLPLSPAPADKEHSPGSSDEDESDDEGDKAGSNERARDCVETWIRWLFWISTRSSPMTRSSYNFKSLAEIPSWAQRLPPSLQH